MCLYLSTQMRLSSSVKDTFTIFCQIAGSSLQTSLRYLEQKYRASFSGANDIFVWENMNLLEQVSLYNVETWVLKHYPLCGNGSLKKRAIARQRPATTIEDLLGALFYKRAVARPCSESRRGNWLGFGHEELRDSREPVRTWVRKLRNLHGWDPLPRNDLWRHISLYLCCSIVICSA
jgi:hypothetical protein